MRDDPTQTALNYKDWFNEQDRNTQIDIIGPARYREFQNGKEITTFAKDGRIMTLEELGIDRKKRITRQLVFEEIYKDSAIPHKLTEKQIYNYYSDKMTDEELQKAFLNRYTHIEIDIVGKMPKEQMQILFREYDSLLQKYPVGSRLMSIKVDNLPKGMLGQYDPRTNTISFDKGFVNDNVSKLLERLFKIGHHSTDKENHTYIHEYAHAMDFAMNKNGKSGRHSLIELAKLQNTGKSWRKYAKIISEYATKIYAKNRDYDAAELFSEAFTAFRNEMMPDNKEIEWIIDFLNEISL